MKNKYLYGALALAVILGAVTLIPALRDSGSSSASQTAAALQPHSIAWNPAQFPSSSVEITLIRKVSSNPDTYQAVRTLSASVPNNGSASWVPASGELDGTTYIQIGCVSSASACQATVNPAS